LYDRERTVFVGNLPFDVKVSRLILLLSIFNYCMVFLVSQDGNLTSNFFGIRNSIKIRDFNVFSYGVEGGGRRLSVLMIPSFSLEMHLNRKKYPNIMHAKAVFSKKVCAGEGRLTAN